MFPPKSTNYKEVVTKWNDLSEIQDMGFKRITNKHVQNFKENINEHLSEPREERNEIPENITWME